MSKGKKRLLWIVGIVIALIIIVSISTNGNNETSSASSDTSASASSDAATPKEWVALTTLKGNGTKKSNTFVYNGGEAVLRYDFNSKGDFGMMSVYVVKKGEDVMRDGGFPEVMINGSEKGGESSLSHIGKGEYYVYVMSANGSWNVTVEELM